MSITIEMTGKEDLESPWKVAVAGYPGAGKTLFASTARNPLFVFFEEAPRLKSIAHRHIPHVKLLNSDDGKRTVQDQLLALVTSLHVQDHEYQTLVIDTGDELQQRMKQARRLKQGGEFGPGDWNWLADTYREVLSAIIDLPLDVIVLYHLKSSQEGEEGYMVRDLALQGANTDQASGWFDVVGVLDTFETADEQGDDVTKRFLLTSQSRTYSWLKDHSGQLPTRFEISPDFVGDFPRMKALMSQSTEGFAEGQEHQVIGSIEAETPIEVKTDAVVPTPEELQSKKLEKEGATLPEEEGSIPAESGTGSDDVSETGQEPEQDGESPPDSGEEETEETEESPTADEAEKIVTEELGAERVYPCDECGEDVEDAGLRDLTQIRFRKILCRTHFTEKIKAARV